MKQVKLTEDQWVSELLPLLEDEPFRIVSLQGLVACTDYKVVIKCLEDFYASVGNELEWQRRFQGRTQKPQEQLLEFVGALRVLADRAYPKWSAEQRKELLRNQFVQGVRSSLVQLKLMKEMPATLEDALTMANQIQTVEEAQKRLQKDRSQMETCELGDSTSNVISGGETNSLEERRLPEQLKRTEAVVQQLAKQVQQLLSEQSTGKQRVSQAGTWGDRRQRGPQQGLVCWACGKQGHIKRNCLSRKGTQKKTLSETAAVSSSLFVFGYIAGRRTKMLVDTGSAVTIVKENVWEEAGCAPWNHRYANWLQQMDRKRSWLDKVRWK